jgi:cohesin complex subunit SA-1/2
MSTRGSLRNRRARSNVVEEEKKTLDLKRTRSRSRGGPHSSKKKEEAEETEEEESTKKERGKQQPQKSILKTRNKNASSGGAKKKKEEEEEDDDEEDDEEEEEEEEEKEIPPVVVKEKDEEEDAEKQLPLVVAATPQQQAEGGADEMEEEEEEEEEEQGLFEWLAKKEKLPEEKANRLAAEWTTRYQEDQASAAAEMYTLLTKASGCKAKIYKPELMNSECAIIMKRIEDELRQGNVNPVDPMAGKGKLYRNFKDDLGLFMRAVVRETIDSRDLFDDTMFEMFREIFQTCSNSTARVMRVVATGMGLNVISGLVNACLSQSKQAALKQRQLDNALASKRKEAKVEAEAIKKTMDQCSKNTEACAGMIKEMFNGVFTGRFRDYDPQIRAGCMAAVSNWMLEYPFMFLTDFYLKYLGWSMNDKSSLVRLEVLKGLRRLYADGTKASIMDGFTNRFSARIKELLFDADPMVTCEAIFVVSQLREYETYDADTMNEVLHLLTEENESVRVTAAKVLPKMLPSLLEQYNKTRTSAYGKKKKPAAKKKAKAAKKPKRKANKKIRNEDDENSTEDEEEDEGEKRGNLFGDDEDNDEMEDEDFDTSLGVGELTASETLESVLELVKILSNTTHAKHLAVDDALETHSKIIDAVWDEMPLFHSFEFLAMKLSDEEFCSDIADAAALANLTLRAVKKSQMENIIADALAKSNVPTPAKMSMTKRDRETCDQSREKITLAFTTHLPTLLEKYSVEDEVLAPLLEIIPYMKLEHYPLRQRDGEYQALLETVKNILFKRVDSKVLNSAAKAIAFCANDGYEGTRSVAVKVFDSIAKHLGEKLSQLSKSAIVNRTVNVDEDEDEDDEFIVSEDNGDGFILKCALLRVTALLKYARLSKLEGEAVFEAMATLLDEVSRNVLRDGEKKLSKEVRVGPVSAVLLAEGVMYEMVWRGIDLSESESERVTDDDILSFQNTRDKSLTSLIRLAENVDKLFGKYGAKVVADTRRNCTAAVADAVLYLKMAGKMSISLPPNMMTAAWRAADKIMTPEDENLDADVNAAKIGYQLALVDAKCGDHSSGSIAAPAFISNFAIGGDHLDAAIKGFMTELRRDSQKNLARTIFMALADAYQVVSNAMKDKDADEDIAQRAIDFLRDLATRIASIFSPSVQRDRLVVRVMTADCVNYALVPLKPERFAFLEYAVSAFIPKISQVDAKNVLEACEKQLEHVDESDKRSLSFKEFIEVVRVRSLGKSAAKVERERKAAARKAAKEDETETSFEEEDEIETDSELAGATPGSNKTRKTNANSTPGSEKKRTLETEKDFAKIVENEESKEETITTTANEGEAVDADMEDVVPVQKPSRRGRR